MIGIGIANSIGLNSAAAAPDPSAAAYFTATGITGATQQAAINNLVKGLKSDGLWSKMKAVYPFVTDNRNLESYTENFGNAYWTVQNASIITNSTTAPNGTTTADTLIDNLTNAYHGLTSLGTSTVTSGLTYVGSIYAKYNGRNIQLTFDTANLGSGYANFDLQNGVLGSVSGGSATITNVGDGWYRCTFNTVAASTGTGGKLYPILINSLSATRAPSYVGNGTSGTYIWGAQLELGSTATTYQPIATTQQAFISNQFKYNLVNPVDSDAAFRLVFNGGWTHSANGATPNGTNGYADTKLVPSSVLTLNSTSFSIYSRTNSASGLTADISSITGATSGGDINIYPNYLSNSYFRVFDVSGPAVANTNTLGLFIANRISNTETRNYIRNVQNIVSSVSTTLNTGTMILGAGSSGTGPANFSNRQLAFSHLGQGLTDTEAANLYTRVQAFQTALSRQV